MNIRVTLQSDLLELQGVLDSTGLFPSDLLPELIAPFLSNEPNQDLWLTCEVDGTAIGFCYAVPEKLTDGTWNMLAIAVLPELQGSGAGSALVAHLESVLRGNGQRVLIADTSGSDSFERTRAFYRRNGYTPEARIRDFWAAGDDKIVFWKSLA